MLTTGSRLGSPLPGPTRGSLSRSWFGLPPSKMVAFRSEEGSGGGRWRREGKEEVGRGEGGGEGELQERAASFLTITPCKSLSFVSITAY